MYILASLAWQYMYITAVMDEALMYVYCQARETSAVPPHSVPANAIPSNAVPPDAIPPPDAAVPPDTVPPLGFSVAGY